MLGRGGQPIALLGFSNREEEPRRPIALWRLVASVQQPETTVKPGLDPQAGQNLSDD